MINLQMIDWGNGKCCWLNVVEEGDDGENELIEEIESLQN